MNLMKFFVIAAFMFVVSTTSFAASKADTLLIDTKDGQIVIELLPEVAPKHVDRLRTLANQGFYDGIKFHRVISGFMAQTGDPKGDGTGGSNLPDLKSEFSNISFERGVVGMARSQNPHSGNSQFFIMFAPAPFLNNKYTVFGRVTKGMDVVDKVKKGSQSNNGAVTDPDAIVKMRTADKY